MIREGKSKSEIQKLMDLDNIDPMIFDFFISSAVNKPFDPNALRRKRVAYEKALHKGGSAKKGVRRKTFHWEALQDLQGGEFGDTIWGQLHGDLDLDLEDDFACHNCQN